MTPPTAIASGAKQSRNKVSALARGIDLFSLRVFICFSFFFFIPYYVSAKPAEVHAIAATPVYPLPLDVMDDPAIWVNKRNPVESLVLGTNKRPPFGGLFVYTLFGQLKEVFPVGPLNNVDIRADFSFKEAFIDIAAASEPEHRKLAFFSIDPQTGKIMFIGLSSLSFEKVPYGFCLSREGSNFYAIITFKGGGAEKWEFWEGHGKIHMKKRDSYPIESQAEGCVANDAEETLFIAEEDKGIWAFKKGNPPHLIAKVGEHDLVADLEGLTLYKGKYLIVSSQGNSTYGVFLARAPYSYLGSFAIRASSTQEGTEGTDGIAVTAENFGGPYSTGLFVAHDNRSSKGGGSNFKYVPWKAIAQKLNLE